MKREISFLYSLSPDFHDRLRVIAMMERGAVVSFMAQYEALIDGTWHEIVRYDSWHGFAHKDIIHPDGKKEKVMLSFPDFNQALTFAIKDLKASWEWYRVGYKKEMGK